MVQGSINKESLLKRIESFRKWKLFLAVPLIVIGVFGLLIPILPGLLILFVGVAIIKPELAEDWKNRALNLLNSLKSI